MDSSLRLRATQRFCLRASALPILSAYVDAVCVARADGSRSTLEAAKQAWAAEFGLGADDGLVLTEFASEAKTLGEARASLEICGCSERQLRTSIDRCLTKGLLEVTVSERAREQREFRNRSA